ncbi:hypothetical protein ASG60_17110 [Methylobacterium sp. Leaf469]|nr:hypothetical protein ASG60_17110 [Methylobacterium sp. Leaf469]
MDCEDAGMTERSQCGCANDGLAMDATSGVTPPLLPTLVMALVLGAASLFCREPEVPAPAPTTLAARIASAPATLVSEAVPATPFVPAALTFPRQFPLMVAAHVAAPVQGTPPVQGTVAAPAVAQHRPSGPRVAALRRPAPAKAIAAPAAAQHADPVGTVAQAEVPVEAGGLLPDLALPFAPAIRAVGRARDFVGVQGAAARTQASALGGAVVDFVGTLR